MKNFVNLVDLLLPSVSVSFDSLLERNHFHRESFFIAIFFNTSAISLKNMRPIMMITSAKRRQPMKTCSHDSSQVSSLIHLLDNTLSEWFDIHLVQMGQALLFIHLSYVLLFGSQYPIGQGTKVTVSLDVYPQ